MNITAIELENRNAMSRSRPSRGFVIPAINTESIDYVSCAKQLKESILYYHPKAEVVILTEEDLPHSKQKGYSNDWQCFLMSPFKQTIKLEADMILASPIEHWWDLLAHKDVVVSTGARDFFGRNATSRHYRKIFDANNLPDVYNAITYWTHNRTALTFFRTVREIFSNWDLWKSMLAYPEDEPSTDVVYAIAATILGVENVTLPPGISPTIVHMKKHLVPIRTNNWTNELVWETDPLRIQTVAQEGLVHYYVKEWRAVG